MELFKKKILVYVVITNCKVIVLLARKKLIIYVHYLKVNGLEHNLKFHHLKYYEDDMRFFFKQME